MRAEGINEKVEQGGDWWVVVWLADLRAVAGTVLLRMMVVSSGTGTMMGKISGQNEKSTRYSVAIRRAARHCKIS